MALSGSFYKNVNAHWRLQMEWSATQSVSDNRSYVTSKLYWIALDSYGAVNSSATKTVAIQYNNGSWDKESKGGMAALSGNQKKLIHSKSFYIYHDDDGTATFSLDAYFDAEVTLSGTYYGRIDLDQTSFTLDTIPRESTMTTSRDFTAGSDRTINISRHASSFRHEVELYVQRRDGVYDWINQVAFSASQTSRSTSFTTSEKEEIFRHLDGRSSASVKMVLQTFSGSTFIGSKDYYGTVTAPSASSLTSETDKDVYIDQSIYLGIARADSEFTHTVKIYCGGSLIKTFTGVGYSVTWNPTQAEKDTMYAKTPTANEVDGNIEIFTYYGSELVRSVTNNDIDFHVRNSNPVFSASQISYEDVNAATALITGDNQYIIQNQSDLRVWVNSEAVPRNSATIASYEVTVNGVKKVGYQAGWYGFGKVNAEYNINLGVKAIDSRGNSTAVTKVIKILAYRNPTAEVAVTRLNNFENQTTISANGNISSLYVGATERNDITSLQYRYKDSTSATWPAWTDLGTLDGGTSYLEEVVLDLDNTKSFNVEVRVSDNLQTTIVKKTVSTGKPILFIDAIKKSIGLGDFPTGDNQFFVNMAMLLGKNKWASGGGGFNLGNSDVVGANGFYYADVADNNGEGQLFLKDGATPGSTSQIDYWNWRVAGDGRMFFNNEVIAFAGAKQLWSGAWYMHEGQSINVPRNIMDCPNGWVFVWSDFDPTSSGGDNTENNYNFVSHVVFKWLINEINGASHFFSVPSYLNATTQTDQVKELFIYKDKIVGSTYNDDSSERQDVVLRKVYAF